MFRRIAAWQDRQPGGPRYPAEVPASVRGGRVWSDLEGWVRAVRPPEGTAKA